ncbi:MAG TPA: DMT family transporter [Bacillota bacterium]|nr:DMT family transporter [Bacillota bacterium]HRU42347.1 DMT family transporter [Candidatus Diapherotrites archaeon]HQE66840.1 DMT family transporter [Bacillota bacterium]HQI16248.1 DMT family transporter [Bacillota bacterium]HQJ36313.1 DMT family transporter [Bacillota bacterium]
MSTAPLSKERSKAMLMLAATAAMWSIGGLLIKMVDASPLSIAGARAAITSIVLLIYLKKPKFNWSLPQVGAAISSSATAILFITATKTTTAANAILLQSTAPIYVAILGSWLLKEKATKYDWLTVAVVMGGMGLFFVGGLSAKGLFGNVCAVVSGITYAFFVIFMRMQKDGSPLESTLLANIITAVIGLPFLCRSVPNTSGWFLLLILGVFQLGIPYVFYSAAIKKATALEAVLISIVEPILNPLLVFLALGEAPGIYALLGGAIVLASITLKCVLTILPLRIVTEDNKEQPLD